MSRPSEARHQPAILSAECLRLQHYSSASGRLHSYHVCHFWRKGTEVFFCVPTAPMHLSRMMPALCRMGFHLPVGLSGSPRTGTQVVCTIPEPGTVLGTLQQALKRCVLPECMAKHRKVSFSWKDVLEYFEQGFFAVTAVIKWFLNDPPLFYD